VGVDSGSLYRRTHSLSHLAWSEGRRLPGTILHLSDEPGELSQWLCHDDSTINIGICIIFTNASDSTCIQYCRRSALYKLLCMYVLLLLQDHNCVRELRSVVQQQQSRLNDLQMDVNEVRIQYTELRRDLRTIRVRAQTSNLTRSLLIK